MFDKLYDLAPHFFQNWMVTIYDVLQYRKRHGDIYFEEKEYLIKYDKASKEILDEEQNRRLVEFLQYCKSNSAYYVSKIGDVDPCNPMKTLLSIPILSKEELRINQGTIKTIDKLGAFIGKTGGTTGKSLEVNVLWEDAQMRFAMLDVFRERFGYQFGKKTAWFSGKGILTDRDITSKIFWKTDLVHNIRYYSTFHISDKYIQYYIDNLWKYKPEFIVGFPSSIVEIARYGIRNQLKPMTFIKAIFPTAETKDPIEARDMLAFFGADARDQYASSEGANFITECEAGNLHYDMLTGIIEVVDNQYKPTNEGRMLITSFTTRGTPLIRYDIGDRIRLSNMKKCPCGRHTPVIDEIIGRLNDYLWSPENGKVNLGNVSNCVKSITEIVKFQTIQNHENEILIKIVKGVNYTHHDEISFLSEMRARVGNKMVINIEYVNEIALESSGKFRLIKNNWSSKEENR